MRLSVRSLVGNLVLDADAMSAEIDGEEINLTTAVDVYVTKLRDKLSACDGFKIVTVRDLGYKAVIQNE